mgnify:CR=1 FL=1
MHHHRAHWQPGQMACFLLRCQDFYMLGAERKRFHLNSLHKVWKITTDELITATIEYGVYAKMYSTVNKREFVCWLQAEMDKRGWNQADLARESGLSRGAVGNVLRQERDPGKDFLIGIAYALKLPPETVFRIAGVLPEVSDETEQSEQLLHLYRLLPEELQNQLLEYARFLVAQVEAEVKRGKR